MIFTPNQVEEVLEIINRYHLVFIAHTSGPEVLSDMDKQVLESAGIDIEDLLEDNPLVEQAFRFGMLSDAIGEARAKRLSYSEFTGFLKSGKFIPLTKVEQERLNVLKNRTYNDVRTLGGRISQQTRNIILEEGIRAVGDRESIRNMANAIARRTGDWIRDFDKISDYVMHTAFNEGRATNIEKQGIEKVYFDVYPGACKECVKHYLTAGVGSEPKIFTIVELRANGTNIGRKVPDWKPTLSPMHPWCRCTVNQVRVGYAWNEETRAFDIPVEFRRKVQRRSRVSVTVGDKTTEI